MMILLFCTVVIILVIILFHLTRGFWVYSVTSDPDQIHTYYKTNLRNNKRIKVSREEYNKEKINNLSVENAYSNWKNGLDL